jgi:hypothetical protein
MLNLVDCKVGDFVTYANGHVGRIIGSNYLAETITTNVYVDGSGHHNRKHTLEGRHSNPEWCIIHVKPEAPVDLHKAQPGDTVIYSDGAAGIITEIQVTEDFKFKCKCLLSGFHTYHRHNGASKTYSHKYRVIAVEPAIDLSKAQPGNTVIYANGSPGVFKGNVDNLLHYSSYSIEHGVLAHTKSGKHTLKDTHPLDIKTVISCTHPKPTEPMQLPTEGITATRPTIKDADSRENVQVLTGEGWGIKRWDLTGKLPWAHTPNYRPLTKKDLALQLSNNLEKDAAPSSHLLKLILNYLNE